MPKLRSVRENIRQNTWPKGWSMSRFLLPRQIHSTQILPHRLRAEAMPKFWNVGETIRQNIWPRGWAMPNFFLPSKNYVTQLLFHRLRAEAMPKFLSVGKTRWKIAHPGVEPCSNFSSQEKNTAPNSSPTDSGQKLCPNSEVEGKPAKHGKTNYQDK